VIAITAYTEPVLVEPIANDSPHINESDENEERSSFSELLAGLLQSTQSVDLPITETGVDALAAEITDDGTRLSFFAKAIENGTDLESSGFELSQENQNILLSADQLLSRSMETEIALEDNGDLPQDFLNAKLSNTVKEQAPETELSSISKSEDTGSDAQLTAASEAAAKQINKDAASLSDKKKTETSLKTEAVHTAEIKSDRIEQNQRTVLQNENSRLDEFRRSRRDRVSFEVRDLRTVNSGASNPNGAEMRTVSFADNTAGRISAQPVQEVLMDLRLPAQGSQAQTSWEVKAGTAMENMIARELHQNFNGDIVRHASMVLKNGGEGIIRITLHPETLGNVKIHLEMTENKITGRIVVQSEEALNAFRKELTALEQAFKDSGYADASLELSLSADGSGADGELNEGSFNSRLAALNYEDGSRNSAEQELAPVIDVLFGRGSGSVNMLA